MLEALVSVEQSLTNILVELPSGVTLFYRSVVVDHNDRVNLVEQVIESVFGHQNGHTVIFGKAFQKVHGFGRRVDI